MGNFFMQVQEFFYIFLYILGAHFHYFFHHSSFATTLTGAPPNVAVTEKLAKCCSTGTHTHTCTYTPKPKIRLNHFQGSFYFISLLLLFNLIFLVPFYFYSFALFHILVILQPFQLLFAQLPSAIY